MTEQERAARLSEVRPVRSPTARVPVESQGNPRGIAPRREHSASEMRACRDVSFERPSVIAHATAKVSSARGRLGRRFPEPEPPADPLASSVLFPRPGGFFDEKILQRQRGPEGHVERELPRGRPELASRERAREAGERHGVGRGPTHDRGDGARAAQGCGGGRVPPLRRRRGPGDGGPAAPRDAGRRRRGRRAPVPRAVQVRARLRGVAQRRARGAPRDGRGGGRLGLEEGAARAPLAPLRGGMGGRRR